MRALAGLIVVATGGLAVAATTNLRFDGRTYWERYGEPVAVERGTTFVTPNGSNYPWTRGSSTDSTYAEWNIFSSPEGPNAPDIGTFVGGTLPTTAPSNVFDAAWETSGSFITGGGNIYSFNGAIEPRADFQGFDLGATFETTIVLQIRTLGSEPDLTSMLVNDTHAPTQTIELDRIPLGGEFGGVQVDNLIEFVVPGNAAAYTITWVSAESSCSLDRVILDTYTVAVACDGDVTGDQAVDLADLNIVLFNFGTAVTPGMNGDATGDGLVDLADLNLVLFNFGSVC